MIDITKNYQDVKIYGFAIANFNHTKFFHFLYIMSGAHHQHTSLTFKKKYINLLLLSLYKGSWRVIILYYVYFIIFLKIIKKTWYPSSFWSLMGWRTTWNRKNNIWCWNKEILLFLFCKYSRVLNIIVGFTKYCQFVLPYCQYMVVFHQNLVNMLYNSVIIQSLLRIRKKNINFQV